MFETDKERIDFFDRYLRERVSAFLNDFWLCSLPVTLKKKFVAPLSSGFNCDQAWNTFRVFSEYQSKHKIKRGGLGLPRAGVGSSYFSVLRHGRDVGRALLGKCKYPKYPQKSKTWNEQFCLLR